MLEVAENDSADIRERPPRLRLGRLAIPVPLARFLHRPESGAFIGTAGVFIVFSIAGTGGFLSETGIASCLDVAAPLGIIAVPVGLLMMAGQLDLSIGSVVAASSLVVPIASGHYGLPIAVGIALALGLGVATGLINAVITARTRLPSFIVTLGTMLAVSGLTLGLSRLLTGSVAVAMQPPTVAREIFAATWKGQFEVSIVWWIGISVICAWVLHATRYGNWILATGGDAEAAHTAGVPTKRVNAYLFMSTGFAAALVGVIQTITYGGSQVNTGQPYVFNAIIAVVIGGILLTGGYGSVIGIVLGVLTYCIVSQGIYFTQWNSDWASAILGGLLLAAVIANNTFRRLALSYTAKGESG